MLSRTADNLFWLGRYAERAENTARLVDVTLRLASAPSGQPAEGEGSAWHSAIVSAGCEETYYARYNTAVAQAAIVHLVFDRENPSSIVSCIDAARRNARIVRTAVTSVLWEALNTLWLEFDRRAAEAVAHNDIAALLDWITTSSMTIRGAAVETMLRGDAYWFLQLGTYIERGDNSARILDVKYHVLLPDHAPVGSAVDYFQWAALLRALSAARTYGYVFKRPIEARYVAELVILHPEMPRSLAACLGQAQRYLADLEGAYGRRHACQELADARVQRFAELTVDDVFAFGMHEFLTEYVDRNNALTKAINEAYLVYGPEDVVAQPAAQMQEQR
ncbi:MAG: alpha-E domain-containing protein [Pseudomonadota bacterium]